jgi:hypothetical protein
MLYISTTLLPSTPESGGSLLVGGNAVIVTEEWDSVQLSTRLYSGQTNACLCSATSYVGVGQVGGRPRVGNVSHSPVAVHVATDSCAFLKFARTQ